MCPQKNIVFLSWRGVTGDMGELVYFSTEGFSLKFLFDRERCSCPGGSRVSGVVTERAKGSWLEGGIAQGPRNCFSPEPTGLQGIASPRLLLVILALTRHFNVACSSRVRVNWLMYHPWLCCFHNQDGIQAWNSLWREPSSGKLPACCPPSLWAIFPRPSICSGPWSSSKLC